MIDYFLILLPDFQLSLNLSNFSLINFIIGMICKLIMHIFKKKLYRSFFLNNCFFKYFFECLQNI